MIREFQEKDIVQVMNIWLSGNEDAHPFIPKNYWHANYDIVQKQISQAEVFVCGTGEQIQGFIGIVDGYIAGIFVDAKYRSLGIGTQLLDHAKTKYTSLSLSVYQKNKRAVEFYLRGNFSISSEDIDENTGEREYTMLWKSNI